MTAVASTLATTGLARPPRFWAAVRLVLGVGILALIAVRIGSGPFLRGLQSIDLPAVGAAAALTCVATLAAAWRWRVIAGRLGVEIAWPAALAAYYRSQFINTFLPGGILGDVHRAADHGRRAGALADASRAVAVERGWGQLVQFAVTAVAIAAAGQVFGRLILGAGIVLLTSVLLAAFALGASGRARAAAAREGRRARTAVGSPAAAAQISLASFVVVACHASTFVVAAAAVGIRLSPVTACVLALIVLAGASVPVNVGGWGPREGVAGWVFGAVGAGVAAGVAAATAFGVLTAIAVAPGGLVLAVGAVRRRRSHARTSRPAAQPGAPADEVAA